MTTTSIIVITFICFTCSSFCYPHPIYNHIFFNLSLACGSHGYKGTVGGGSDKNIEIEGGKGQGQGHDQEQPVVIKGGRGPTEGVNEETPESSPTDFTSHATVRAVLWFTPRVCSGVFVVLLLIWLCGTSTTTTSLGEGGFGGKGKMKVFGWHALFMTLFAVVFTNEGGLLTFTLAH